jgi:single-strand DNA-binding protein
MNVNKVILIGRLGRDPETRYTGSGQAVCNFSLATDESFKDRSGERQKHTEWHNIVVWAKQAEIAQQYLHKGSLVYVEGKIQSHEYESRDGIKKTSYEIVASNFRMLDKKESAAAAGSSESGQVEVTDDDIPF